MEPQISPGKYIASYDSGKKYLVCVIKDYEDKTNWYFSGESSIFGMDEWRFDDWREVQSDY